MAEAHRRSAPPILLATVLVAALLLAAGCGAGRPGTAPSGTPSTATHRSGAASPNTEPDLAAIRTTIATINATAGATVAQQRAALQAAVAPGQAEDERNCPTATSTLAFKPAYRDLRRAVGATDHAGSDSDGTEYLLPTLIVIYRGDRIVGNDMTTLRLWVSNGVASTAALCVA